MSQKIQKLIAPFIILPLVTGGLVSFVAFSFQGSDVTRLVSNARSVSVKTFTLGKGTAAVKVVIAAFTASALSLLVLFFLSILLPAVFADIAAAFRKRIRNRSPPFAPSY